MSKLFPTPPSRFQEICDGLRALYLADPRPWLIGFSGGKDSTLVAALGGRGALVVPPAQRGKEGHLAPGYS